MCDEIDKDFSNCMSVPHPLAKKFCRDVTIGLAHEDIDYFAKMGEQYGISAERVMTMYLRHIVYTGYKVNIDMPKVAETVGDSL
jgi:hypothetical protein